MARGAIFDVDGTLVDSVDLHARAWQETFRRFGKEIRYAEVRAQIGKGADQLMPVFFSPRELERIGEEMERTRGELFRRECLPLVRPLPRVRELFEKARAAGLRIALASSAEREEVEGHVRLLGIEGLVESATSSDDAERSKPHPDIFRAALDRLRGIDASAAVAVGDTPYDAEAAGKLGLRTIGVLSGGFPAADLRGAGCVEIYRDPADLADSFERSLLARGC